jgi:hypothetical protein
MKYLSPYIPHIMAGLFLLLVCVTAAKAIPMLFIPLLSAIAVIIAVVVIQCLRK